MEEPELYRTLPITEQDTTAVLLFLKRTFFKEEPLNKSVGLSESKDLEKWCLNIISSGYSFKAVDQNQSIIGVMLNSDIEDLKERDLVEEMEADIESCLDEKFKRVLMVLIEHEKKAEFQKKYPEVDKYLNICATATDPAWQRKGIMKKLLMLTENKAKSDGISLIRLDTSNAYSQKAAVSGGYTCISKISFADIKINGVPITLPDPPHIYDHINVKILK